MKKNKILLAVLRFFRLFTIKKAIIFMDNLYEDDVECIDAYSQFCYMLKRKMNVYYIIRKRNPFYQKLKEAHELKHIIVVKDSSKILTRAFWPLCFTKTVVSAFCNFNMKHPVKKLIADFFYKDPSIDYIYLDHGVVFLKKWVLSYYSPEFYNKLIVSNNYEKEIYINEVKWTADKLIDCGLPRWGNLNKTSHEQKNIFIYLTWRTSLDANNYAQSVYYKRLVSLLSNQKFKNLLQKNNVKLNIAFHHAFYAKKVFFEELAPYINIVDVSKVSSFISTADLFITDYSSIVFDFMYLDTPVIFYKLDWDDINLNKDDRESMYYAMTKDDLLYNCVYYEDDLISLISRYINNDFKLEKNKKDINNNFFFNRKNIQESLSKILIG